MSGLGVKELRKFHEALLGKMAVELILSRGSFTSQNYQFNVWGWKGLLEMYVPRKSSIWWRDLYEMCDGKKNLDG